MRKVDVKIGGRYVAKVSEQMTVVRIVSEVAGGFGWNAVNETTGRTVRIKTAQRLRSRAPKFTVGDRVRHVDSGVRGVVDGKAQTFHSNGGHPLYPVRWTTGSAMRGLDSPGAARRLTAEKYLVADDGLDPEPEPGLRAAPARDFGITAAEQAAKTRALELLPADGSPLRTVDLYRPLLELDGVGTTRMYGALRALEADEKITVDRDPVTRRAKAYRLRFPTSDELEGAGTVAELPMGPPASTSPRMTDAARRVLNVVALREDLPVDGWDHYLTGAGDDGVSTFHYDRPDGRCLIVNVSAEGHVVDPRSILVAPELETSVHVTGVGSLPPVDRRARSAELVIVEDFDAWRSAAGHDYGAGQRARELRRRRRELALVGGPVDDLTPAELFAAFERIGPERIRRIEREDYRRRTPATERTIRTWRSLERDIRRRGVPVLEADDALSESERDPEELDAIDELGALEARGEELERLIDEQRREEPRRGPDYAERSAAWSKLWEARFDELRAVARRVAELTPHPPAKARELAAEALEIRAAEADHLARNWPGPDANRDAIALRSVAASLEALEARVRELEELVVELGGGVLLADRTT